MQRKFEIFWLNIFRGKLPPQAKDASFYHTKAFSERRIRGIEKYEGHDPYTIRTHTPFRQF